MGPRHVRAFGRNPEIVNGIGQPFSGAVADRFGTLRALIAGAILYSAGLVLMAYSTTPGMLTLSAGVLIGFGLSGASMPIVLAAFGKLMPPEWRSTAFGIGTAAGSFGQFLFSPLAVVLIGSDRLASDAADLCLHRAARSAARRSRLPRAAQDWAPQARSCRNRSARR